VNQLQTDGTYGQIMAILRTQPWCKVVDSKLSTALSGLTTESIVLGRYAQTLSTSLWQDYIRSRLKPGISQQDFLINATVDPKARVLTINMPVPDKEGKIDLTAFHRVKVGYRDDRFWYEEFSPEGWNHYAKMAASLLYGNKIPRDHKFVADVYEPVTLAALNAICACHFAGISPEVIIDMAQDQVI